ncbi:MAG: nitroreductase family deazaflavin-dependent oxidoreductase [Actinomycetota bacterium]|nr:nitroreductase family deazaflavin-dependent oxidoreductase [Actinomycetota bacterium]
MAILESPQTVDITTVGARTGLPRRTEILLQPHGEALILIASKAGAPTHPAWFHNLVANPEVTVHVPTGDVKTRARVTEGEEREQLWTQSKQRFPGFADYEMKTERVIPVVLLEPVQDTAAA